MGAEGPSRPGRGRGRRPAPVPGMVPPPGGGAVGGGVERRAGQRPRNRPAPGGRSAGSHLAEPVPGLDRRPDHAPLAAPRLRHRTHGPGGRIGPRRRVGLPPARAGGCPTPSGGHDRTRGGGGGGGGRPRPRFRAAQPARPDGAGRRGPPVGGAGRSRPGLRRRGPGGRPGHGLRPGTKARLVARAVPVVSLRRPPDRPSPGFGGDDRGHPTGGRWRLGARPRPAGDGAHLPGGARGRGALPPTGGRRPGRTGVRRRRGGSRPDPPGRGRRRRSGPAPRYLVRAPPSGRSPDRQRHYPFPRRGHPPARLRGLGHRHRRRYRARTAPG